MVDAWKDSRLPEKQLALNRAELAGAYPEHWTAFLSCLRRIPDTLPVYDIGCGVGATYALLRQEGRSQPYIGLDFSEAMIQAARTAWSADVFVVEDYRTMTRDVSDGILYCTGLLDIVDDGVRELTRLLSFRAPYVILNRINLGRVASVRMYQAYDTIPCYSYTFSVTDFESTIRRHGYQIEAQTGSCFLLRRTA